MARANADAACARPFLGGPGEVRRIPRCADVDCRTLSIEEMGVETLAAEM